MSETVTAADLRALLGAVDAFRSAAPAGTPGWTVVLEHLCGLIGCDSASLLELDVGAHEVLESQQCGAPDDHGTDPGTSSRPSGPEPGDDAFWYHYDACLGCSYPTASGDCHTVTTMSDFYSRREFHATGMYVDYLGPLGVEHEAMLCLPAPAHRSRRVVFFRSGPVDFDGRDRALLTLLRPHLAEADQARGRAGQPDRLTPRQQELLRLVALGHSNREVARELGIAPGTVRKHLENIFGRLGVQSRTAAAAQAFPAAIAS